jgi:hypothetical protein
MIITSPPGGKSSSTGSDGESGGGSTDTRKLESLLSVSDDDEAMAETVPKEGKCLCLACFHTPPTCTHSPHTPHTAHTHTSGAGGELGAVMEASRLADLALRETQQLAMATTRGK